MFLGDEWVVECVVGGEEYEVVVVGIVVVELYGGVVEVFDVGVDV